MNTQPIPVTRLPLAPLPLDGVLLCYAAFALACLFPGRQHLWAGESAAATDAEPR